MKTPFLLILVIISSLTSWSQTFIEYPNNPVIDTLSTTIPSQFWTRWKTDPFVIAWDNDSLRMYYGTNNYGVETQIGTAVSANGNNWTEKRDAPVLTIGPAGSWDGYDVETPGIIYVPSNPDSMKYMLYYSGSTADSILLDTINPTLFSSEIYQLGLAYSADGINFTKYNDPSNDTNLLYADSDPVIKIPYSSGSFPDTINYLFASVAEPSPMYDSINNIFKMWYIGLGCSNPTCSGASDYRFRVLYSESVNGIDWSPPVVSLNNGSPTDFDSELVYAPHVIKMGTEYWMFYGGNDYSSGTFFLFTQSIGLATSTNGINFTKFSGNPVISGGTNGTWNNMGSNYPSSIVYHDTLRVYYSGMQDSVINFVPNIGYSFLDSILTNIKENPPNTEIALYPNPSNGLFTLNVKNELITRIAVYDYTGKLQMNKPFAPSKKIQLDTSSLPKGSYIVLIYNEKQLFQSKRLIIN